MKKLSLMEVLEGIEDGRRERNVWYPLHEVLFIMLVAAICGATSYVKDAIHYKVKEDHRYVTKAAYVVLGITMDGRKDILGVWIGEHESSKFWLSVLNDP